MTSKAARTTKRPAPKPPATPIPDHAPRAADGRPFTFTFDNIGCRAGPSDRRWLVAIWLSEPGAKPSEGLAIEDYDDDVRALLRANEIGVIVQPRPRKGGPA
ncbi:hypothetical protein [Oharaeibacter diazotrophicus]|uniref:Uncharacterized protein n=1 Tax=Oharaeibacter diazotrophicus TaxID=1920512 RepID=A0A4R6RHG0_9HYPH|nr:hypothetical protein [Oharaeibacter diazotrophicus]TDP85605.1 hypothetical protein EDD54_2460 [Oharaeibacter diazotrophicus]BBE74573.1 hypothetical protein OHA_1_04205 [Pleomorphomonas sp. SM30]GLS75724.1 hypothetical protein GCM10007904_10590 [Oharaeibacter diazotrophicus]